MWYREDIDSSTWNNAKQRRMQKLENKIGKTGKQKLTKFGNNASKIKAKCCVAETKRYRQQKQQVAKHVR